VAEPDSGRDLSWLNRLSRLLGGGRSGRAAGDETRPRHVEELLLAGPRRFTKRELVALSGLDSEFADRLWRSLGFAEVGDDEVVFTEGDRAALGEFQTLRQSGLIPDDVKEAMSRSVGQAMAGLADWQVEMLYQFVGYGHGAVSDEEIYELGERVIPLLEELQTYVWRRHLAAAAIRLLHEQPEDADTRIQTVGFAELVDFSRTTRRVGPAELTDLIEDFHRIANEVVAAQRGRVVKTVGDEVMFVADHPEEGAEIALRLLERLADAPRLPQLRIGLAEGSVVCRFGDVYGEVVNIASRLTSHAHPGRVLVERNLATALREDDRFAVRMRRALAVRGYRHLQTWGLTRPRS